MTDACHFIQFSLLSVIKMYDFSRHSNNLYSIQFDINASWHPYYELLNYFSEIFSLKCEYHTIYPFIHPSFDKIWNWSSSNEFTALLKSIRLYERTENLIIFLTEKQKMRNKHFSEFERMPKTPSHNGSLFRKQIFSTRINSQF